jgi:hypothetical protein
MGIYMKQKLAVPRSGGNLPSVTSSSTVSTKTYQEGEIGCIITTTSTYNLTYTLPSAVLNKGLEVKVRYQTGTATVTVNASAGNVNGSASITLTAGNGYVFVSDGANWWAF